MRFRRTGTGLLLVLLLALPARASELPEGAPPPAVVPAPEGAPSPAAVPPPPPVQLLFPPDLTFSTDPKLKIFAFRPAKGEPVVPVVNGKAAAPLEGETFLKGEIALSPGVNLLQLGEKPVRVFLIATTGISSFRLSSEVAGIDLVYQSYRLHPALDDGCEGCHTMEGGKLQAKDQKEACYACHNDFSKGEGGKKVYVHAPVASGECTGCHDPHFAARPKLQKLEKGCHECHDPFPSEGTVHRPVGNGECTACHSPHAGPAPKQLVRAGNALCLGCHKEPHERHRSSAVLGKLTRVPDDFPKEREELACSGCHAPHQSPHGWLFRKRKDELCKTCHLA